MLYAINTDNKLPVTRLYVDLFESYTSAKCANNTLEISMKFKCDNFNDLHCKHTDVHFVTKRCALLARVNGKLLQVLHVLQ